LLDDYEIKGKSGVYEYILSGETKESLLNLRTFDKAMKQKIWRERGEKCNLCEKTLSSNDAHADHKNPCASLQIQSRTD